MVSDRCFCTFILVLLFFLSSLFIVSSAPSSFISDEIFESQTSIGRRLLQAKKACPVSFEFLNYTIITSKCKGPLYSPKLCCSAFTEFACPYVDALNDMTTDCASTMFSYINLYGKYPPGLFSSECREGDRGLSCPLMPTPSNPNLAPLSKCPSPAIILASALILLLSWPLCPPLFFFLFIVVLYTPRENSMLYGYILGYGRMTSYFFPKHRWRAM